MLLCTQRYCQVSVIDQPIDCLLLTLSYFSYTTRDDAYASGLVYAQEDGTVIMKGDNTTHLDHGVPRKRFVLFELQ